MLQGRSFSAVPAYPFPFRRCSPSPRPSPVHIAEVTREGLIEFHKTTRSASQASVHRFRQKVETSPKVEMELFYHNEPFDIACRIAGQPLDIERHIERYIEIRDVENPLESGG